MNRYLLIAIGAALGANARYLLAAWANQRLGADFPYGTFIANVSGSFLLGFLLTLAMERVTISPEAWLFLAVGFLGSYTTFSSFTVESLTLLRGRGVWSTLVNILGNNLLGLAAAGLGFYLARALR